MRSLGVRWKCLRWVNCRGFSARENRGFTKVSTRGTEAGLWSTDGGQKDIDPETQSINKL